MRILYSTLILISPFLLYDSYGSVGIPSFFVGLLAAIIFVIILNLWLWDEYIALINKACSTTWYSFIKDSHDSWDTIKMAINNDPILFTSSKKCSVIIIHIFSSIILLGVIISIGGIIYDAYDNRSTSTISSLGFMFTGCAAVIAFIYQTRLKSRTEQRSVWLNNIRDEMSKFFGMLGWIEYIESDSIVKEWSISTIEHNDGNNQQQDNKETHTQVLTSSFSVLSKLELLLNPNEKLHRTLVTLMRLAIGIGELDVDKAIYNNLNYELKNLPGEEPKQVPIDNNIACAKDNDGVIKYIKYDGNALKHSELISQIFRVAQLVLKIEWERVKGVK